MSQFALLFDIDGVVLDNNDIHEEAWLEYAAKLGKLLTAEEFYHFIGGTNEDILEKLFPGKMTLEEKLWHGEQKEALYRAMFNPTFEVARGLRNLLKSAKEVGAATALASNGPVSNVEYAMNQGDLFPLIDMAVSAYQVGKPKPAPDVYLKAMELIGAKPETSVIFEDSKTGLVAAQATGCIVVGITTTLSKAEMQGKADYAIDSFEEIDLAWIERVILTGKPQ